MRIHESLMEQTVPFRQIEIEMHCDWMYAPILYTCPGGGLLTKIVNIDVRVRDGVSLRDASERWISEGSRVELHECSSDKADRDEETMQSLLNAIYDADIVAVRITGGLSLFCGWSMVYDSATRHGVPIIVAFNVPEKSVPFKELSGLDDGKYVRVLRYLTFGGPTNQRGLIAWCLNRFDGEDHDLPEPRAPPAQGAYIPGTDVIDIDEAVSRLDPSRPAIMVMFGQRKWASGRIPAVDRLYGELRARGAEALCVFLTYAANNTTGSIGIRGIIDEHLMRDGRPTVDFVINMIFAR